MEPTTTTPSTARIALQYGLYTGLGLIIYSLIVQLAGLAGNQTMGIVGMFVSGVVLILGIIYALKDFRSQNGGYLSYGQGLGVGSLLAGVAGLISGIFTYIYLSFIDNSAMKEAMDKQREALEARGMSDEQIEQAIAMAEKFSTPGMAVVMSIIGMALIGFVLSLIIAAIMKRDSNPMDA